MSSPLLARTRCKDESVVHTRTLPAGDSLPSSKSRLQSRSANPITRSLGALPPGKKLPGKGVLGKEILGKKLLGKELLGKELLGKDHLAYGKL